MKTEGIISNIKTNGSFPDDAYFTTDEYERIINNAMKIHVTPLLLKLNEDYLLATKEYTVSEDTANYRVPARAIGTKLRDVKLKDSSGNYTHLLRLYEEDRGSGRSGYFVSRNSIELSDDIKTGTLLVSYFIRPSDLISEGEYAVISSIDTDTNTITVESLPSGFLVDTKCDLVQADSPYDLLDFDTEITAINTLDVTFSSLPEDLQVGDYLCLAKQSPVPQVPEELEQLLIQAALVMCLAAKKDQAVKYENEVLKMMKEDMVNMLDPRVESNDTKIRPQGLLRKLRNR
jgi:uncharacterized protein YcgL (UPF0745 family)